MLLTYHAVGRPIAAYLFWRFGAVAEGVENIPRTGPVLLVGNHQNEYDGVQTLHSIPRRIHTVIKSDGESRLALFLLNLLADMFTINRSSGDGKSGDVKAVRKASRILKRGGALCMFPEAHRSREVIGFHPGVATIARQVERVPIVPFGITNSDKLNVGKIVRNLHRGIKMDEPPTIKFGCPFHLPPAYLPSKQQREEDVAIIRRKVLDLLPPELEGENKLWVV